MQEKAELQDCMFTTSNMSTAAANVLNIIHTQVSTPHLRLLFLMGISTELAGLHQALSLLSNLTSAFKSEYFDMSFSDKCCMLFKSKNKTDNKTDNLL